MSWLLKRGDNVVRHAATGVPVDLTPGSADVRLATRGMALDPRQVPAELHEPARDAGQPAELRLRPGDQPLPTAGQGPDIQSLVIADIGARRKLGISRYGRPLEAFNGRDALKDAYDEAVDLACYLRQAIAERDTRPS